MLHASKLYWNFPIKPIRDGQNTRWTRQAGWSSLSRSARWGSRVVSASHEWTPPPSAHPVHNAAVTVRSSLHQRRSPPLDHSLREMVKPATKSENFVPGRGCDYFSDGNSHPTPQPAPAQNWLIAQFYSLGWGCWLSFDQSYFSKPWKTLPKAKCHRPSLLFTFFHHN